MADSDYLLENRKTEAAQRFIALPALYDPVTLRQFDACGMAAGWRCWEVGAGGPALVRRIAEHVGPAGHVLATDIDDSWAKEAASRNMEVRTHDVAQDAPPGELFDLVHARLVLVHIPERERALRNMIAALKPGGWLVIEDADPALQPLSCIDAYGPEQELATGSDKDSGRCCRAGEPTFPSVEHCRECSAEPVWGTSPPRLISRSLCRNAHRWKLPR